MAFWSNARSVFFLTPCFALVFAACGGSGGSSGVMDGGGLSTGGVNTGGLNTGGVNTGGINTGGINTGGINTGGINTGGVNTGGVNTGGGGTGGGIGGAQDSGISDSNAGDQSADQSAIVDPPPTACDAGGSAISPGGTLQCPDDKNLEGCPCPSNGATAACWPGYRKNRNHGNCKDGVTSCVQQGPNVLAWSACQGFTGIDPATFQPLGNSGKAACECFSTGSWKIDNLFPCFVMSSSGNVLGAVSTIPPGNCPTGIDFTNPVPPSQPWTTDTLTVDCTGYFQLCYTLKALPAPGAPPSANDCTMARVCTQSHYNTAVGPQVFPALPSWITATPAEKACAQAFYSNGAYGEMSVSGQDDLCEMLPERVFQTVKYCALVCADPAHATDPQCVNCQNGGGGPF